jgi:putative transposase
MIVLEMKAVLKPSQSTAIDEAICTVQFIRNKDFGWTLNEKIK